MTLSGKPQLPRVGGTLMNPFDCYDFYMSRTLSRDGQGFYRQLFVQMTDGADFVEYDYRKNGVTRVVKDGYLIDVPYPLRLFEVRIESGRTGKTSTELVREYIRPRPSNDGGKGKRKRQAVQEGDVGDDADVGGLEGPGVVINIEDGDASPESIEAMRERLKFRSRMFSPDDEGVTVDDGGGRNIASSSGQGRTAGGGRDPGDDGSDDEDEDGNGDDGNPGSSGDRGDGNERRNRGGGGGGENNRGNGDAPNVGNNRWNELLAALVESTTASQNSQAQFQGELERALQVVVRNKSEESGRRLAGEARTRLASFLYGNAILPEDAEEVAALIYTVQHSNSYDDFIASCGSRRRTETSSAASLFLERYNAWRYDRNAPTLDEREGFSKQMFYKALTFRFASYIDLFDERLVALTEARGEEDMSVMATKTVPSELEKWEHGISYFVDIVDAVMGNANNGIPAFLSAQANQVCNLFRSATRDSVFSGDAILAQLVTCDASHRENIRDVIKNPWAHVTGGEWNGPAGMHAVLKGRLLTSTTSDAYHHYVRLRNRVIVEDRSDGRNVLRMLGILKSINPSLFGGGNMSLESIMDGDVDLPSPNPKKKKFKQPRHKKARIHVESDGAALTGKKRIEFQVTPAQRKTLNSKGVATCSIVNRLGIDGCKKTCDYIHILCCKTRYMQHCARSHLNDAEALAAWKIYEVAARKTPTANAVAEDGSILKASKVFN